MPPPARPRPSSSPVPLRPLHPPPWTASPVMMDRADEPSTSTETSTVSYPSRIKRPFDDPHEVLCHAFNVMKTSLPSGATWDESTIPDSVDMPILRDAHMPTHALIVLDSFHAPYDSPLAFKPTPSTPNSPNASSLLAPLPPSPISSRPSSPGPAPLPTIITSVPSTSPLVLPINVELFAQRFTNEMGQLSSDSDYSLLGSTLPVPYWDDTTGTQRVTLPTIPLHVPHPPSLPLLLLYGLGLHDTLHIPASDSRSRPSSRHKSGGGDPTTSIGTLAAYLLPVPVIEEFPAAPAMVETMVRGCTDADLRRWAAFNQGMWANVLALAPANPLLVEMVHTAWTVTAEARRSSTVQADADSAVQLYLAVPESRT